MAKIKEQGEKGKVEFFKTNDIVGIPFEIVEDVNASSDFRETKKKELKDGETEKQPYQIIDIKCNGEVKEWHLTMSALRSLRNVMPPGAATWKGVRCVVNSLASGYTPTKITRLMGDYAMPKDQQVLGQVVPPAVVSPVPPVTQDNQDPRIPGIMAGLRNGQGFFKDGLIPFDNVMQACQGVPALFQMLKDKGLIFEPMAGFYKVI